MNDVISISISSSASGGTGSPHTAAPTLRLLRRGQVLAIKNVPPTRTLLEVLREDLGQTGTKEACRSGDCGACTVVVAHTDAQGHIQYRPTNSCIRLAHAVDGQALWTVEDVHQHPIQTALVRHHASQCGFCTPGIVMSLFALYQQRISTAELAGTPPAPLSREDALHALSGNLCRCTGYRPILDAALEMFNAPLQSVDETELRESLQKSELLTQSNQASIANFHSNYLAPRSLDDALRARAAAPQAQIVAGATDVGLWITKQFQQPAQVLDVSRAVELQAIAPTAEGGLELGAAVTLEAAFAALVTRWPLLHDFAQRFAGRPVRETGTLGGNVANGSPIGDSMPLLLALGASVRLMQWHDEGAAGTIHTRELALEDFYLGYRRTALGERELLTHILIPPLPTGAWVQAYKVSKRWEDDISAVCLGLQLVIDQGHVQTVRLGLGGMAATPVRAHRTEAALLHQPWTAASVARAAEVLRDEFQPLSDMRASAQYRRLALAALLERAWSEHQSPHTPALQHLTALELRP